MTIPQTSMMKDSHLDGRSLLRATLLGGWIQSIMGSAALDTMILCSYLKQGIGKEKDGERNQILAVANMQIFLHIVKLHGEVRRVSQVAT